MKIGTIPMLAFAVFLMSSNLPAESSANVVGQASVIDGDTLEIRNTRIRLQAIDAPETGQLCRHHHARPWRCGQAAALALSDLIDRRSVLCSVTGQDRYGRALAHCFVDGQDLAKSMVRQGWAIRYYDRKARLRQAEIEAQQMRRGIWAGSFDTPSDWRRSRVR